MNMKESERKEFIICFCISKAQNDMSEYKHEL